MTQATRARRRGRRVMVLAFAVALVAMAGVGEAQSLWLSVTPGEMAFPDANPSLVSSIAGDVAITLSAWVSGATLRQPWSVNVLANNDFASGAHTIAITNVTWTASHTNGLCTDSGAVCSCAGGTLSKTTPRRMINGQGNASAFTCTQYFSLANRWTYSAGSYTATITYTISAP